MVAMAVLELLDTPTRWELTTTSIVGRSPQADVTVAADGVSRSHLEIQLGPSRVAAVDLGSRNGTAVNGRMLEAHVPHELDDGDVIVLAGQLELRFRDPMATPTVPRIGRLTGVWLDPDTGDVWVDARRVEPPLSSRQLALLDLLYRADGAVVSRAEIVDGVWDDAAAEGVTDDAVTALIRRVRQRLIETSGTGDLIDIVRGRGVRLLGTDQP